MCNTGSAFSLALLLGFWLREEFGVEVGEQYPFLYFANRQSVPGRIENLHQERQLYWAHLPVIIELHVRAAVREVCWEEPSAPQEQPGFLVEIESYPFAAVIHFHNRNGAATRNIHLDRLWS